jgi:serralysin
VLNVNDPLTGTVSITGTPIQGQSLTAANTLADPDGLGVIAYQWKAGGQSISGATTNTLLLTGSHVGAIITVSASYTDGHGTSESAQGSMASAVAGFQSGTTGEDNLTGTAFGDTLLGLGGKDTLNGLDGADTLDGGAGNDSLNGGGGIDTAKFSGAFESYKFGLKDSKLVVDGPDGHDSLTEIEFLQVGASAPVAVSSLSTSTAVLPLVTVSHDGITDSVIATPFSGTPIPGIRIDYEFLGGATGEVDIGTEENDFINLLGGDDAAAGGGGDDILDGGTGSNFLSGGAGADTFFLDGRGGSITWSTITDWGNGEQLSVWGWKADSKVIVWRQDGAEGFKGITMHADLNNDGTIDTSVTWTGKTESDLPTPGQFVGQELLWFT